MYRNAGQCVGMSGIVRTSQREGGVYYLKEVRLPPPQIATYRSGKTQVNQHNTNQQAYRHTSMSTTPGKLPPTAIHTTTHNVDKCLTMPLLSGRSEGAPGNYMCTAYAAPKGGGSGASRGSRPTTSCNQHRSEDPPTVGTHVKKPTTQGDQTWNNNKTPPAA
jgi:hypothetical protein